ncbi:MAG: peptide deformylase [Oscillospiraceae bacterium]|jgi:peptide deformylase|nr:peptide deformylase [Oscillospiraceae bacterium]
MSIRQLVRFDDKILRKISRPVEKFDERLWSLLDDMLETLRDSGGFGMAAPHIGILRRVILVDDTVKTELVNPVITAKSEATQRVFEGSIAPGAPWGFVVRPQKVTVEARDRLGNPVTQTAEGFLAATFCHEIDHLDGILFTEKSDEIVSDTKEIDRILTQSAKQRRRR